MSHGAPAALGPTARPEAASHTYRPPDRTGEASTDCLTRVLRPDGAVAVSTHHPAADVELAESGDYFATELLRDVWTVGGREREVRFWHRPLSRMFREIAEGGFRIDELNEPQPLPEVRERDPEAWERLTKNPHFLFLRLSPS